LLEQLLRAAGLTLSVAHALETLKRLQVVECGFRVNSNSHSDRIRSAIPEFSITPTAGGLAVTAT